MRPRLAANLPQNQKNMDKDQAGDDAELSDQPQNTGSLRRQIAASLLPHHRLAETNGRAVQSPATPSSSFEAAQPYKPCNSLKSSNELLKLLNRIWSLEEQHSRNVSLVKALKLELDDCRDEVKNLQRKQQKEAKKEINGLINQAAENSFTRKNKKQEEKLKAAIQTARDELNKERKLRRRSDKLHRNLARELSEMKSCLSKALEEVEKERKSRILLETLCDEFARSVKSKSMIDKGNSNGVILDIQPESDKISPDRNLVHGNCRLPFIQPAELQKTGSCSKLPRNVKGNSLKAKLMEARLESECLHSRSRSSKAPL